jgi:hypothetical protein
LDRGVAVEFFWAVVEQARGLNLLSDEHFTADGTLVASTMVVRSPPYSWGDDR